MSSGGDGVDTVDAAVLGAGISGLVSASVLLRQGCRRVLVVDSYDHVGGNHIDVAHGGYTFDVGSLIFQDDSPLLDHLPDILPRYVPIDPTWGKLTPQGAITRYPFSVRDDLIASGPVEVSRILLSAAYARVFVRRLQNARDFARHWIGARLLHRSGLENYMERFCGLPAERIDLLFAEKRMMWIAEYASVPGHVRRWLAGRSGAPTGPPNRQLVRPREGFAHLYAPAVQRLEREGVTFRLAVDDLRIRRVEDRFAVEAGGRRYMAARVVSTVPIEVARQLCGMPECDPLPTVTLVSLFFSFAGRRGFDDPILYNFSHGGTWKRLTVYSDFYGRSNDREFFTAEVVVGEGSPSVADADRDFRSHVRDNGLFVGDLRLEGAHVMRHAYPIYTGGAGARAQAAVRELKEWGLESFGRQGGFAYQPTSRTSTVEAEAALDVPRAGGV